MAQQATHKVLATVGTYKGGDGSEKKRYVQCGMLFTDQETGRMSIKLDAVPCSPDWSGWLQIYPRDDDDSGQHRGQQSRPATRPASRPAQRPVDNMEDDSEVPF